MRTFDYRHLPARLFDGKVGDANARLFEDKGKLDMLERMRADDLMRLRKNARIDNVDASTRIEGLYIDQSRVRDVIAGAEPLGETEAQIKGYANALSWIEENAQDLELDTSTVVALYERLYGHRDLGRKSRYRKKDYQYVQVDGHVQAMPVSPITAFETPLVLGGACDSLAEAFSADRCSPLILSAVFTVDFLCIRPFEEGNGRISRLFAELMLLKAGFNIGLYESVDRVIEESAMGYYNALNDCVEGWDRARNDYTTYALYWMDVLHRSYERLFTRLEAGEGKKAGKTDRVVAYVRQAGAPVSKRQLRDAFPDISEATIEAALGKMVKDGVVEKMGAGRSTAYRFL